MTLESLETHTASVDDTNRQRCTSVLARNGLLRQSCSPHHQPISVLVMRRSQQPVAAQGHKIFVITIECTDLKVHVRMQLVVL